MTHASHPESGQFDGAEGSAPLEGGGAAARHRDPEGAKIGMWLVLFTEMLLFGGLFLLYSAYRARYPDRTSIGTSQ